MNSVIYASAANPATIKDYIDDFRKETKCDSVSAVVVNGKEISLSAPLTVASVNTREQMGRNDLSLGYALYAHILNAKAKYYRTFILEADIGLDGSLSAFDADLQELVK